MSMIDYSAARTILEIAWSEVEADPDRVLPVTSEIQAAVDLIFRSNTQAYREVVLGCVLAKIIDPSTDITQPYMNQGPHAFNGRTLDEQVINPFLHDHRIPASRGPYLSVFRRSVQFNDQTRSGLRDTHGYDAALSVIKYAQSLSAEPELHTLFHFLLQIFYGLREAAVIPISRLHRISLEQYEVLITGLLALPSGGRFPVMLVLATFQTIKDYFNLDWSIASQGINVADSASGAGGDITISSGDQILLAAEVTEREVDRNRVLATFQTKITMAGIEDYLFFVRASNYTPEAKPLAHQYFSQGHEVNFLDIKTWILITLATVGSQGRRIFNQHITALLNAPDVPRILKVNWNQQISTLIS